MLKFDNDYHDFGRMKKGSSATHVYPFTNMGTEDIVIEIASGCHCSVIKAPEGQVFKTGEKGEITVTFNTETEKGEVEKTVDIILENTNPKNGYPIILELKYHAIIYE